MSVYGENCSAFQMVHKSVNEIQSAAMTVDVKNQVCRFQDKSFIALDKWGNHQAFLPNGWNITPSN